MQGPKKEEQNETAFQINFLCSFKSSNVTYFDINSLPESETENNILKCYNIYLYISPAQTDRVLF